MIHIVTHYDKQSQRSESREEALKNALDTVWWPSVMCSLTTSVGFASTMISAIPMVRQVGLILSLGVLLAGPLTLILTTAMLARMNPIGSAAYSRMSEDLTASTLNNMKRLTFAHYTACTVAGIIAVAVLLTAIPNVKVRTEPLQMFPDDAPQVMDIRSVQENLSPIRSLEVLIELGPNALRSPATWKKLADLEARLSQIDNVVRIDSLLPLLEDMYSTISEHGQDPREIYSKPGVVSELLLTISFSPDGKRLLHRYLETESGLMRMTLRLSDFGSLSVADTIATINRVVETTEIGQSARVKVTGALAVYAAQVSRLAGAQTMSLLVALCLITVLMTLQFRSVILGLLSLIPNFLPMAVIFGFMGWFGIALDTMTIFAATVSIGLSVDDTIHYVTQLKRQMWAEKGVISVRESLSRTHDVTARALISTSAVLALGFLSLLFSPFPPVAALGVLLSCGVIAALIGDLVFMPSLILSFPLLRRLLRKTMVGKAAELNGDLLSPGTDTNR
jgi:predicted RND superfamily exporter protein